MANEHLQRTPTSSGNRSTYTWSGWIKRNVVGGWERLFSTAGQTMLQITGASPPDQLRYFHTVTGNFDLRSTALLRDVGSWMHILYSVDHTNQHSKNRVRIYINGAEVDNYGTDSTSNGSQNLETYFNSMTEHALLGRETTNAGENFQGEAFDIFWVDGQALTPDVFGFYKDGDGYQSSGTDRATDFRSGQWSPRLPKSIKHTINRGGGFGVNGFYIPMNDSSNFGADFHCDPNSIIKLKGEDEPQPRNGAPTTSDSYASQLRSDPFAANLELAIPGVVGGLGSGFGDYSHLIRGNGSAKTVTTSGGTNHRDGNSYYGSAMHFDGTDDKLSFDNAVSNPGTQDFTYEFWVAPDDWSGTYTGLISLTAATGADRFETAIQNNTIQVYTATGTWADTGFELPKNQWTHLAFERYNGHLIMYVNGNPKWIVANTHNYDEAFSSKQQFGKHGSSHGDFDGLLQDLRFYTGVAKYKGGFDVPNPYSPQAIATHRARINTCKNNFVTMNPLSKSGCTISNGNLTVTDSSSSGGQVYSTMGSDTGKWYYEAHITDVGGPGGVILGINPLRRPAGNVQNRTGYRSSGDVYNDSGSVQHTGTSYTTGDTIGVAWDADNKKLWFAKNGSWVYSGDPVNGGNQATAYTNTETQGPSVQYDNGAISQIANFNFGQNPTLSDNKANEGKRLNSANNSWTLTWGGSQGNFTVSDNGTTFTGTTASSAYMRATYTLDPKKKYIISLKYTAGANNTLAIQDDEGYITTTDGTATSALQVGNIYAAVISASTSVVITATNWNTTYTINNIHLSEYDACYTDDNGKGKFQYQPPTGFLALCDDNLPTPAVADPGKHFKTVLWTGNGNNGHAITKVGFKPDLVWIFNRDRATYKPVFDSIRGGTNMLRSNQTAAQGSFTSVLQSFDSDGFTVGNDGAHNFSGERLSAWCWKAGGPAVTNNDGGSSSLVSANQEAGFSIVKFTAQTSGSITLGHGLGKKPAFWIWKDIGGTTGWYVYHQRMGASAWLQFDAALATTGNTAAWGGVEPTTTVFTHGWGLANQNDVIMYIWAEIQGYSKFGNYIGNGSDNGPHVHCGFRPAWVLIKKRDGSGDENWRLFDSSRCPTNQNDKHAVISSNGVESTESGIDLLSNGFKVRHSDGHQNQSGSEYIFAAFAESPFQTANAK